MKRRWLLLGALLGVLWHGMAGGQVTVDSVDDVGICTSLAVVNGNPAISYHKDTPQDYTLKYARALDATGSTWGAPITLDNPGSIYVVGLYTSLAVVNGNPAVSYLDWSYGDLKYIRATDANGSAWAAPVIVDSAGTVGLYTSLAVVDGNPAIGYFDETNGDLKYARATNADGSAWGTPLTVDSPGNVGLYASLAVVDGNPAISYFDETNFHLKFVRAMDSDGNAWGTPVTVDSTGLVGRFLSLAVIGGYPAISYYDISHTCLKYVQAINADGSTWGIPAIADNTGDVGEYTSLAEVSGSPAVSYFDWRNRDLKYWRGSTVALTMAVSPAASGATTPPAGSTTNIVAEVAQAVTASPTAGYHFVNWTADPAGNAVFGDAAGPSTTVTLTVSATITAHFAPDTYTVIYDGNGDTGGTSPYDGHLYLEGDTVTVQDNTGNLARSGFTFNGWSTAPDDSGTSYAPGDTFPMPAANVTLYAQWAAPIPGLSEWGMIIFAFLMAGAATVLLRRSSASS